MRRRRLPAEWEEQDGILIAWPHAGTDWLPYLDAVQAVFVEIARQVSRFEKLVVAAPQPDEVHAMLLAGGVNMDRVKAFAIDFNDTWARDFGPITVYDDEKPLLLDFEFNGWGLKFAADLDNQITRSLSRLGAFGNTPLSSIGFILEGGSIESDGRGTIMTTSECLLSPNRNPHLSRDQIESFLGETLGADRFLWIEAGALAGDDTDSHVDTLARLCPNDVIVYTECDDPEDEHHNVLEEMFNQLNGFRTRAGKPYRLMPLPLPDACYAGDGHRIPATYANFLIINQAVLVPTYGSKKDAFAMDTISKVFPDRQVIGIDCLPLVTQHGSLHCVTMQVPKGVLS